MAEGRHQLIVSAVLLASVLPAACSTMPVGSEPAGREPGAGERGEAAQVMRPVSASLLQQSRAQRQAGDYAQAAATLDRAIRIDPAEPAVWLALAELRYAETNWPQAEQLARKAESLAPAGSAVRFDARELIADSLRQQGHLQEVREFR